MRGGDSSLELRERRIKTMKIESRHQNTPYFKPFLEGPS